MCSWNSRLISFVSKRNWGEVALLWCPQCVRVVQTESHLSAFQFLPRCLFPRTDRSHYILPIHLLFLDWSVAENNRSLKLLNKYFPLFRFVSCMSGKCFSAFSPVTNLLVFLFAVELLFQEYVPEMLFLFKVIFSPPFPRKVVCAGKAKSVDELWLWGCFLYSR